MSASCYYGTGKYAVPVIDFNNNRHTMVCGLAIILNIRKVLNYSVIDSDQSICKEVATLGQVLRLHCTEHRNIHSDDSMILVEFLGTELLGHNPCEKVHA